MKTIFNIAGLLLLALTAHGQTLYYALKFSPSALDTNNPAGQYGLYNPGYLGYCPWPQTTIYFKLTPGIYTMDIRYNVGSSPVRDDRYFGLATANYATSTNPSAPTLIDVSQAVIVPPTPVATNPPTVTTNSAPTNSTPPLPPVPITIPPLNEIALSWWQPTNYPGGKYVVCCESQTPGAPRTYWLITGTNAVLPTSMIPVGITAWQVIPSGDGMTNTAVVQMLPSGIIEIMNQPAVTITSNPNNVIATSTNLGMPSSWVVAGSNSVTFPTSADAQRFFVSKSLLTMSRTNVVSVVTNNAN